MSICASVYSPRIICPPDQRTFNSDGTRVAEVGLKQWEEGGKREGKDGKGVGVKSIVGQMQNPTFQFGEETTTSADDASSLKSGWSGDTLGKDGKEEKGGKKRRGGSLIRQLFHGHGHGREQKKGE